MSKGGPKKLPPVATPARPAGAAPGSKGSAVRGSAGPAAASAISRGLSRGSSASKGAPASRGSPSKGVSSRSKEAKDGKEGKGEDDPDEDSQRRREMARGVAKKKKKRLNPWQKFKRTCLRKATDVVVNEHTEEICDKYMGARTAARRRRLRVTRPRAVGDDELSNLKSKFDMIDLE